MHKNISRHTDSVVYITLIYNYMHSYLVYIMQFITHQLINIYDYYPRPQRVKDNNIVKQKINNGENEEKEGYCDLNTGI